MENSTARVLEGDILAFGRDWVRYIDEDNEVSVYVHAGEKLTWEEASDIVMEAFAPTWERLAKL